MGHCLWYFTYLILTISKVGIYYPTFVAELQLYDFLTLVSELHLAPVLFIPLFLSDPRGLPDSQSFSLSFITGPSCLHADPVCRIFGRWKFQLHTLN